MIYDVGMELIQARRLVDRLCADEEWLLMTRLLTGIQRYTEMNYVFVLLKEKDQFEYLLRRSMDRLPLLRTALLDFLRRNCPQDTELFRMVGLIPLLVAGDDDINWLFFLDGVDAAAVCRCGGATD